jgi:hypothetical protein
MTVYDLISLFIEDYQEVTIYDLDIGDIIYIGTIRDMDYEYKLLEVMSIDCIENNILTINVMQ